MSLSSTAFDRLADHWAVKAVPQGDLQRSDEIANYRLARRAVGEQIDFHSAESADDGDVLRRVALVYRVIATMGLDALAGESSSDASQREIAQAACHRAFGLLRVMPCREGTLERLLHVLEVSAVACCGERWPDLRRWYRENDQILQVPEVEGVEWDRRLLYRLFDCWIRVFRKDGWSELDAIQQVIAGLREEQHEHEGKLLATAEKDGERAVAFRLVALYHWAKATELLSVYLTQGDPPEILGELDKHFKWGVRAFEASRDTRLEMVLCWLHAAAKAIARNPR